MRIALLIAIILCALLVGYSIRGIVESRNNHSRIPNPVKT